MRSAVSVAFAALLLAGANCPAQALPVAAPFQESKEANDARMQWFRDAKFGMFIHWGLYSQPAGKWKDKTTGFGAEWIQEQKAIPSSQYSVLAKTWNPTQYNPREWVRLMKAAGIKYVCITTKHHDGFCLWPTKMNDDWNIACTPGGKDLLKPLADACRAEGLQFCIYHSVMDWHHPDWPGRPAFNDYAKGQPDKARFKQYLYGQLKELFSNYGPIGMVWFDGTWDRKSWTSEDGKALEDYTRSLQPSVILNNRSGYLPPQRKLNIEISNTYSYIFAGDYISPENEVPSTGLPGIEWETCQTMQPPKNWGYNRLVGFRPFEDMLRQLVDVTSKGGNMLLNIGPTAEGEIAPQARQRLEKFAAWMQVNSEAIHGTTASPFERLPFDGRCTQKPGKLFLHVFKWPADGRLLVPVTNKVRSARLLAIPGQNLAVTVVANGVQVALPAAAPDPIDTVVVVEIEGPAVPVPAPKKLSVDGPVEVSSVWPGRDQKDLKPANITDGNSGTIWAAEESAREASVTVEMQKEAEVTQIRLSEGPYARTQLFDVEAQVGGQWKKIAEGTAIGADLVLNFPAVKAQKFRLNIRKANDTPALAEFQLFGK